MISVKPKPNKTPTGISPALLPIDHGAEPPEYSKTVLSVLDPNTLELARLR